MTQKIIAVTGATGRQGSAVTRHLARAGFRVRALSRDPSGKKAAAVAGPGVDLVRADMDQVASLEEAFAGVHGVYSVQNFHVVGATREIAQGRNVADAAKTAQVQHLVQASAGTGQRGTGIPSWESKLTIEDYHRSLGLPWTILRPMAFMELMTDKTFFPNASTFHVMPKLMGSQKPVQWISTDDLGAIAALVFSDRERFLGRDLKLCADVQTIDQVRAIYQETVGKPAPHFPMPLFMFRMFTGDDMIKMWTWLRTAEIQVDAAETRQLFPEARGVRDWLTRWTVGTPTT